MTPAWHETAETTQPWVIYTYGRTHDGWWPFWNSTRVLGRARIGLECCVCGHAEVVSLRIPRFRTVIDRGHHPERTRFLREHAHSDRGHPISWAKPMRNMRAFDAVGGLDLDPTAGQVEADMRSGGTLPCCDLHGRTCEPPSELCCQLCTEAVHGIGPNFTSIPTANHPFHADGSPCSNPDLSGDDGVSR